MPSPRMRPSSVGATGCSRPSRRTAGALALSRDQYVHGLVAFLQVLNAEQQLLATEQQAADSTTRVSTNLVSLYKALGGGWEKAFPDTTAASAAKLTPR